MLARTTAGGADLASPIERPPPARAAPALAAIPGLHAALLDDMPLGALLVDRWQRPVFANPAARAILEKDDGIGLTGGVLRERVGRNLEPRLQRVLRGWCGPEGDEPPRSTSSDPRGAARTR